MQIKLFCRNLVFDELYNFIYCEVKFRGLKYLMKRKLIKLYSITYMEVIYENK